MWGEAERTEKGRTEDSACMCVGGAEGRDRGRIREEGGWVDGKRAQGEVKDRRGQLRQRGQWRARWGERSGKGVKAWGGGGGSRQPRRLVESDGNRERMTETTNMAWMQRQEKKEHGSRTGDGGSCKTA